VFGYRERSLVWGYGGEFVRGSIILVAKLLMLVSQIRVLQVLH
jgi:hypothetical protein